MFSQGFVNVSGTWRNFNTDLIVNVKKQGVVSGGIVTRPNQITSRSGCKKVSCFISTMITF